MTPNEYRQLDGLALAELVKTGQVTAQELLATALSLAEQHNPSLNAIVTPMFDEARQAAANTLEGPFTGVPFLLKDLGDAYAGVRLTGGSAVLQHFVPNYDSEIVRRIKQAGLITFGKTNTPEFGLLPTTESRLLGPCRNPWNTAHSTGGSSGGAAAAVAAGIVPLAHASDGGGSIRIPASCCGLFGLKPTRARTPKGPLLGDSMSGLSISHCLSRTVRDSAALLDAIAGPDVGDPYVAPPPARPFLEETRTPPGKLRIAFTTQAPSGVPIHADCVTAVTYTAHLLQELGHEVIEASPQLDVERFTQAFLAVWAAGTAWTVKGIALISGYPPTPELYEPLTYALYEQGERQTSADYLLAVQALQQSSRQFSRFFQDVDAWLTPALADPPPLLGYFDATPDNPLQGFERAIAYVPFTPIANATGQPAMSVPLYWNEAGLPVGSHFIGRFGDEATLFRLAAQLEQAQPWAQRFPL
jgi:amidase